MIKKIFNNFVPQKEKVLVVPHKQPAEETQLPQLDFRHILESMKEGFANCRMIYNKSGKPVDFRYLYVNPAFAKITGLPVKRVLGRRVKEIIPNIEPFWIETYARVVKSGKSEQFENTVGQIGKLFSIYVWRSEKDCFSVTFENITERKKAEEELALQTVALKSAANGIIITDIKGVILWVNPAFIKLTGYSSNEAIGKSTKILNSGMQDKAFYKHLWNTILAGNIWSGETIDRKKDGSLITLEQTISPVKDSQGKTTRFIAIQQDITDQKKLESDLTIRNIKLEQLSKSQENTKQAMLNVMEDLEAAKNTLELEKVRVEAMLESIGEGLIAVDNNKRVTVINKAATEMLGWKEKDLIGEKLSALPLQNEAGKLIPLEQRPTHIALKTGKTPDSIYYFVRKDKTRFPIAINVTPIRLNEKTIGTVDTFRDVTREIEIDKAKTEFVSLASHQLRTPLGIIKWYIEALENEDYLKKAPLGVRKYINEIYKSNERVLSLVRDLLSVSRIDQGRVKNVPRPVDVMHELMEIVVQMQIMAHKKKVSLGLNVLDKKIPSVNLDPLRFHEIIENLITNAIEYSPSAGVVNVTLNRTKENLTISVRDNGIGISEADQKKLFTKFFRTEKAVSHNPEGSGLGLYVVKSYVETWGGKISIKSKEGKGSTFTISLPINQKTGVGPGEIDKSSHGTLSH